MIVPEEFKKEHLKYILNCDVARDRYREAENYAASVLDEFKRHQELTRKHKKELSYLAEYSLGDKVYVEEFEWGRGSKIKKEGIISSIIPFLSKSLSEVEFGYRLSNVLKDGGKGKRLAINRIVYGHELKV